MGRHSTRTWWVWTRLALIGTVLAALTTLFLSFPLFPSGRLILEEGDIAPRDIRAPERVTYESAIRTAEQQDAAERAVEPVYTPPDASLARQQLQRTQQVLDYLGSVRADTIATPSQRRAWVLAVPELADLPINTADTLLSLSEESWGRIQLEILSVVDEMMRQGVVEGYLEKARQSIPSLISLDLSVQEAEVTAALAQRLITVNSFYDAEATQAAREQARESVGTVVRTYEAGEIIVREGQRVGALELEALQRLGLQRSRTEWPTVIGQATLAVLSVLLLGSLLLRFHPSLLQDWRESLLLALLLSLFLFLARLMVPDRTVLRYLFPGSALAMLVTAALGPFAGAVSSIFLGAAAGLVGDQSLEIAVYTTAAGLTAAVSLGKGNNLSTIFRSGLLVSLANVLVLVGFHLSPNGADILNMAMHVLVAVTNGLVSASLALGMLFLIGPLFDIITPFRLIELSRPDHPLLQRLLREAPGTYHHSLMVANLAEQAAEQIGADALLTRVGAYYHDIGKITRPYFFIENQMDGPNPHERLDPYASANAITRHVKDGLELARRYNLPSRVRDFIPQHHGTKRIGFQYERALEQAGGDPEQVNEAKFHHQGPKPQSKEAALLMLADGCEAIVRARRPQTPEELVQAVDQIFDSTIRSGQLDECPITLEELNVARQSFISNLKGVFHPRIRYPDQAHPGGEPNHSPGEENQVE